MKINDTRIVIRGGKYYKKSGKDTWNRYVEAVCTNCGERCLRLKYYRAESGICFCDAVCQGKYISGKNNVNWRGGKSIDSNGYVVLSPYINGKRKHLKEHRLVMEKHLGRPLTKDETVHHKNGNRKDNRLENLELWSSRHPKGQKVTDLVEWAKEILAKYGHIV